MRLSSSGLANGNKPRTSLSDPLLLALIVALFAAVFALDCTTATAPVQHLYYVPIILSAYCFSWRGGFVAAIVAVTLYHLASPSLLTGHYPEFDVMQILLFVAIGGVTAKLVNDARMLRRLAMTDDLTGLHNLRSFESRLVASIKVAYQSSTAVSLLSLDVDRLKEINDKHGHLAGAQTVRTIGRIIEANIPGDAVACRYGGDEFAIVIPCNLFTAESIATGLCRTVSSAETEFAGEVWPAGTLSISVGVASQCFETTGASPDDLGEQLFREADRALYQAKAAGRSRIASTQLKQTY